MANASPQELRSFIPMYSREIPWQPANG